MSTATDPATAAPAEGEATFAEEWRRWHRIHEERRADPHGFLAVTGLYWLGEDAVDLPDAPGSWTTGPDGPVVELAEGERLTLDGTTLTGRYALGTIPERGGITLAFDEGVIEVARRGGRDLLRPRRPDHAFLEEYQGTEAFAPDPRWQTTARYVAWSEPRPIEVGAAVDGISHVYEAPGHLEFDLEGGRHRLIVFPGHGEGSLLVLFRDATSGVSTYGANRVVSVDLPAEGDEVTLDFNRAVNLPCAYTDFATCPLPPEGNTLPVAVEAGEQTPGQRVEGVVTGFAIVRAEVVAGCQMRN